VKYSLYDGKARVKFNFASGLFNTRFTLYPVF